MPNETKILNYVYLYPEILKRYGLVIGSKDLINLYQLIKLIFEIDAFYDHQERPTQQDELNRLQKAMHSLLPSSHPIMERAIALFLESIERESKLDLSCSFNQYLQVASYSIGAHLLADYLAYLLKIPVSVWFSPVITQFNQEINRLIRLSNDYLDITADQERNTQEISQLKASHFLRNPFQFKFYFLSQYLFHKLHYYFLLVVFKYLKLTPKWQDYLTSVYCAESILAWAYKVYVIDRNSCQEEVSC